MYKFYPRKKDEKHLKKLYPDINWQYNRSDIEQIRKMTMQSCDNDLVGNFFDDNEYIACIVAKYVNNNLVLVFEFILNKSERIGAIVGICTATEHRRKGNTKDLSTIFDKLENVFNCQLYLFVDKSSPLYNILVKLYSDMGFEKLKRKNSFSKMMDTNKVFEMVRKKCARS